jgi:hypothetical protein
VNKYEVSKITLTELVSFVEANDKDEAINIAENSTDIQWNLNNEAFKILTTANLIQPKQTEEQ